MNLLDMHVATRLTLRDVGIKDIPDGFLTHAANEGKDELAKIIRQARQDFFIATATGTISAVTITGTSSVITLPTDFMELKDIRITSDGYRDIEFEYKDLAKHAFRSALIYGLEAGVAPELFYYDIISRNSIRLAPPTGMALAYELDYIPTLAAMVGMDDTPTQIPAEHHGFIVSWMICEALRSRADGRLGSYASKLEHQRGMIVEAVAVRQIREPQFVTGYLEDEGW